MNYCDCVRREAGDLCEPERDRLTMVPKPKNNNKNINYNHKSRLDNMFRFLLLWRCNLATLDCVIFSYRSDSTLLHFSCFTLDFLFYLLFYRFAMGLREGAREWARIRFVKFIEIFGVYMFGVLFYARHSLMFCSHFTCSHRYTQNMRHERSWIGCWCFQSKSTGTKKTTSSDLRYRAENHYVRPNLLAEESVEIQSSNVLSHFSFRFCRDEFFFQHGITTQSFADAESKRGNSVSFAVVMTIVISQLYLIGFNATCDFKKSQFANGLSCISLQRIT